MSPSEMEALRIRLANAAAWAIMMRASIRESHYAGRFIAWVCSAHAPGPTSIMVESRAPDSRGWCEAIEGCHERWVAAVRRAPS